MKQKSLLGQHGRALEVGKPSLLKEHLGVSQEEKAAGFPRLSEVQWKGTERGRASQQGCIEAYPAQTRSPESSCKGAPWSIFAGTFLGLEHEGNLHLAAQEQTCPPCSRHRCPRESWPAEVSASPQPASTAVANSPELNGVQDLSELCPGCPVRLDVACPLLHQ